MKVAIVHDYIKEYGGAEGVLVKLHEEFPDAIVYTTVYLPSFLGPHEDKFKDWEIKTSIAQYLPFKDKLISPLRLVAPILFKLFDFSGFDVIIVSQTGAYTPNFINKKNATLICYCHTPPRYLYGFATARDWKKNEVVRVFGELANHFLRMIDYKASQNVDYFISNSENVAKRIAKFYKKDATVIYPPVLKPIIKNNEEKEEYFLSGGRLARPKHTDLIVKTFTKNKLPLKIFGKGFAGYGEQLQQLAGPNIEFLGEISDEEKYQVMARAKAFVFASEDEDFGITPVEAEALGTPVIAYKSGGVVETVIEGKTGIFFDQLSEESLQKAIERFNKTKFIKEDIVKNADNFSEEKFKTKIKEFVEKHA